MAYSADIPGRPAPPPPFWKGNGGGVDLELRKVGEGGPRTVEGGETVVGRQCT